MPAVRHHDGQPHASSSTARNSKAKGKERAQYIGTDPRTFFERGPSSRAGHARTVHYVGTNPKELCTRFGIDWYKVLERPVSQSTHSASTSRVPSPYIRQDSEEPRYDASTSASATAEGDEQFQMESSAVPPTSTSSVQERFYKSLFLDVVQESGDLILANELAPEEADDPESIPMRVLRDFSIYDVKNELQFVPFDASISQDPRKFIGAAGLVGTWSDVDENDEEEDDIRISLTRIQEVSVHCPETRKKRLVLDPKIYLKTEFAWYILDRPSEEYAPFYAPFWTKSFIFHTLMTSAVKNKNLSYKEFLKILENSDVPSSMIGRGISEQLVETHSTHAYVMSCFNDLVNSEHGRLVKSLEYIPAVADFLKPFPSTRPKTARVLHHARPHPKPRPHATVVTHKIYAICQDLFPQNEFMVCGSKPRNTLSPIETPKHIKHLYNPASVRWDLSTETIAGHYESVVIDKARYRVGDTVMVRNGEDSNKKRAATTKNEAWFAKIWFLYQDEVNGEKMAHVQWYLPGSQTLLQEVAHPRSLYLIDECDDIPLDSLLQKCNMRALTSAQDEPADDVDEDVYFTGLMLDKDNSIFLERTEAEIEDALLHCDEGRPCVSCGMRSKLHQLRQWDFQDGSLVHENTWYHKHDVVYIRPDADKTDVYVLGQIVDINEPPALGRDPTIDVLVYQRYDLVARIANKQNFGNVTYDERRLYRTEHTITDIEASSIEGKAYVVHPQRLTPDALEDWLAQDDHFYVDLWSDHVKPRSLEELQPLSPRGFKSCKRCHDERKEVMEKEKVLRGEHSEIRGLELFAGAGGLSSGLDQSGFVQTKWAVEMEPSAALSYSANHPHTQVYNTDVNRALRHAIESCDRRRRSTKPLITDAGIELPPMPQPGEVDFIYGGPPCQGFSGMNHSKKVDDPRNTLAANMLSYVDFYRPSYFLLENVDALLYAKLQAQQDGSRQVGGIDKGMVKFIMRAMVSMGYQVHFKVLQAGQYGSPQSRLRLIFLGAKRTLPLPRFPIPTHCTPDDVDKYKLPGGGLLWPAVRVIPDSEDRLDWLQWAPFLPVTIEDAISDLPKFDWINPHEIIPQTEADEEAATTRLTAGIARFSAVIDTSHSRIHAGWVQGGEYGEPRSRYQRWMRASLGQNDHVTYHYTAKFGPKVVERTVNVPLKKDANHSNLPDELKMSAKFFNPDRRTSKTSYRSLYARLDAKGPFSTALTTASPNNKGGKVLHPTQKRILTVREFARSQGFPDHQKFLSREDAASDDQYKQIGNAVPVPLALALGKALGKVLLRVWDDEAANREGSPEVPMDLD